MILFQNEAVRSKGKTARLPFPTDVSRSTHVQTKDIGNVFLYPNSVKITDTSYTSTDAPLKITDWYKEIIVKQNMHLRTISMTESSGLTKNVLVASGNHSPVTITIEKKVNDPQTVITIVSSAS